MNSIRMPIHIVASHCWSIRQTNRFFLVSSRFFSPLFVSTSCLPFSPPLLTSRLQLSPAPPALRPAMAKVHIVNVVVLDNPSPFSNPFQFEITFECIEDLKEDLEWKIIYVGSAESEAYDQVLDTVYVGPVPEGRHMFVFQADPPDPSKIPKEDAVGVTVLLLTCSYRNNEFIRIGYYVNNEYSDP